MACKELVAYLTLFCVVLFLLFTFSYSMRLTPGAANVCERTEVYVTKKEVTRIAANSIGIYFIQKETKYEYAVRAEYYCCSGFSQTNDSCSEVCDYGQYGENCTQSCNCSSNQICRIYDGYCFCPAGYQGANCGKPCDRGTFGTECDFKCNCLNGASCDHVNSSCVCLPGYGGINCETAIPSENATDNHTTPANEQAGTLTSSGMTTIAVIVVAVSVILVLLFFVILGILLFVIIKRRSLSSKRNVNFNADNTQKSAPEVVDDGNTYKGNEAAPYANLHMNDGDTTKRNEADSHMNDGYTMYKGNEAAPYAELHINDGDTSKGNEVDLHMNDGYTEYKGNEAASYAELHMNDGDTTYAGNEAAPYATAEAKAEKKNREKNQSNGHNIAVHINSHVPQPPKVENEVIADTNPSYYVNFAVAE